ncbi:MAG: hypothetical protein AMXMBFR64_14940 [Myxococcales bacterium]
MSRPAPRKDSPMALRDLLATLRQGVPSGSRAELGALQGGWERIVGRLHAADTGVADLRGGQLIAVAASEVAARELALLADHVVAGANLLLGRPVVRRLSVRVGEVPARREEVLPPLPRPRELAPGEREACRRVAEVIPDPELRAVFESWMSRHAASGRGERSQ